MICRCLENMLDIIDFSVALRLRLHFLTSGDSFLVQGLVVKRQSRWTFMYRIID